MAIEGIEGRVDERSCGRENREQEGTRRKRTGMIDD